MLPLAPSVQSNFNIFENEWKLIEKKSQTL
jgi:hypothetical protein